MGYMDCTRILVKWCKHHHIAPGLLSFEGYTNELPEDIGGRCYYFETESRRTASIQIPEKIRYHCMLCRIALWHEFCHAELFIKKGLTGHILRWYLLVLRKPHMFIGQLLLISFWNSL